MTAAALATAIARQWDDEIVPQLTDYVRIPAKSPHFDPRLEEERPHRSRRRARRGVGAQAAGARARARDRAAQGPHAAAVFRRARHREEGARDATVLLYGHLDKQPEMTGWHEGFGSVDPALRGRQALRPRRRRRRLCGVRVARGDSRRCRREDLPHARCVGHDRDLRGIGQLRSARVSRASRAAHRATSTSSSASIPAAATTSGCGRRRRCAASPPAR